jgi:hypothetical protein
MSNRHRVEVSEASFPQVGRDHVFSEVELRASGANGTSGIDQKRLPGRSNDEDRIALADVDHGDFHNA